MHGSGTVSKQEGDLRNTKYHRTEITIDIDTPLA
jgi:hypothetical protein